MAIDIPAIVKAHGVDNVKIYMGFKPLNSIMGLISYTSSNDPDIPCLASLDFSKWEKMNVRDDLCYSYKVTLIPEMEELASHDFYVSDLETIIQHNDDVHLMIEVR